MFIFEITDYEKRIQKNKTLVVRMYFHVICHMKFNTLRKYGQVRKCWGS